MFLLFLHLHPLCIPQHGLQHLLKPNHHPQSGPLLVAMGDTVDFSVMDPINEEFLNKRSDEKAQMQLLNNRFAAYIENIRSLKKHNHKLTLEVESLRSYTSSSLTEMRTEEMSKLNKEKDSLTSEITSLKVERDRLKTRWEVQKGFVFL